MLVLHEEELLHVKKSFGTVAIDNGFHAINLVRRFSFAVEETNVFYPWLLKF